MSKRIQFLLSDEEYEYLKEIKETQNKPLSVVIRQALEKTYEIKKPEMTSKISNKKKNLRDYQFCGMWKDRTDMVDSVQWVRTQREKWNERLERNRAKI
jgi:hypothetical protein